MQVLPAVLAGLLALSPAGCADERSRLSRDQDTVTMDSDSLRISLDLPREVPAGQPVPIVLRLENTSSRPLDLYLRGRTIAFDIFVTRPDGEVVWQRLKDEIIPAIVRLEVLQPGEVLELKDDWHQRDNSGRPAGPGNYLVRGAILTEGPPLETAPAPLRALAK